MYTGRLGRILLSKHPMRDVGVVISFIRHMTKHSTVEIWDIDHFMSLLGMGIEGLVRANVDALLELIDAYEPDAVVDFLPSPLDVPAVVGLDPKSGEKVERVASDDEPFSALVFKMSRMITC